MQHLPVFVRLERQHCLVVGGGRVAERKVALLRRAGARVAVVSPDLDHGLRRLAACGGIVHIAEPFARHLLASSRLVVAATDDPDVNRAVATAAEEANVLCNVVDDDEASTFILPAIVDRSPVTIAIGTGGNAPVLAQQLKSKIEAWLPARIGQLAERAGRWRRIVAKRFATMDERRRFWQRFFDGPIAEHILANRTREAERLVRRELIDCETGVHSAGEAWIVGAGPGDPGLVTLRAQQLISRADVILYDRLVSGPVLDYARKEAERIPVGKEHGRKLMPQEEINALLVERVRRGQRVCRLKGGDPFVFGRGGEEAQALADAGLPFQVVPGISAALGCAAYAGIPLTMRGMSGSVTFATAKLDAGLAPDWALLARSGQTLALYMGAASIGETAARLEENGMDADTPVAVVQHGTTGRQRVLHSILGRVGADAERDRIDSPAMVLIGRTAALGKNLQWFAGDETGSGFDDFQTLPASTAAAPTVFQSML